MTFGRTLTDSFVFDINIICLHSKAIEFYCVYLISKVQQDFKRSLAPFILLYFNYISIVNIFVSKYIQIYSIFHLGWQKGYGLGLKEYGMCDYFVKPLYFHFQLKC